MKIIKLDNKMKIIRIIKNPFADKDLALSYTNNCVGDTDCRYETLQSGLDVIKIDYLENDRFKQHFDTYYLEADENTTAYKRDNGWYEIMDVMNNA